MSNHKLTGQILRWLFFIPLAGLIYIISKLCLSWTFFYISSKMVEDISSDGDFGGHYILGPAYIFIREAFAIGFGIYSGVYLAPNNKKIIFFLFVGLWINFLLFVSFAFGLTFYRIEWTSEKIFSNLTEILAQLVGFIVSGIYIWKELKREREYDFTDYEILDNQNINKHE